MHARLGALVRDERGYSLIELLTALAILLTVMVTLTTLMVSATKSEVDLTQRVQAQQEARLALEAMRRDVHCASSWTGATVGTPSNFVTFTLPSGCPSAVGGTQFTWCTNGSGSRWALLRVPGTTCNPAAGRKEADYLTNQNAFTLTQGGGKLDRLCVNFPVDLDPADARQAYHLKDELVLRNSSRTTGTEVACP
jgi:prepilin-type N-terminal cleavage/methylation domain-containing protein